jgi:NTE family protein
VVDRDLVRAVAARFGRGESDPDLPAGPTAADEDGRDRGAEEADVESAVADTVFEALPPGLRTLNVMDMSVEAMQSVITRYRLAGYPPDVLVEVPKDACRTLDFHRAAEMIELGRALTAEALDRWER